MTKARLDGLYLVLLGSVAFLLLGVALERSAPAPLADFKALYYPSRCLIQQHDPYMESEVRRIYEAEGGNRPLDSAKTGQIATENVYPPSALFFMAPFAMLPWGPVHIPVSYTHLDVYKRQLSSRATRARKLMSMMATFMASLPPSMVPRAMAPMKFSSLCNSSLGMTTLPSVAGTSVSGTSILATRMVPGEVMMTAASRCLGSTPVSYTHLDVYKRQILVCS